MYLHMRFLTLGNPSKGRQWLVYAIVLISTPNWSQELSNSENVIQMQFEPVSESQTMLGFAKTIYPVL